MKCPRCAGCGKLATDEHRTPWIHWTELPLHSSMAVLLGVIKPITCPDCGGSGKLKEGLFVTFNCSCVRKIGGSWAETGANRICLFGSGASLSALKRCPECDGTGKLKEKEMNDPVVEEAVVNRNDEERVAKWIKADKLHSSLIAKQEQLQAELEEAEINEQGLRKEILKIVAPRGTTVKRFLYGLNIVVVSSDDIKIVKVDGEIK